MVNSVYVGLICEGVGEGQVVQALGSILLVMWLSYASVHLIGIFLSIDCEVYRLELAQTAIARDQNVVGISERSCGLLTWLANYSSCDSGNLCKNGDTLSTPTEQLETMLWVVRKKEV